MKPIKYPTDFDAAVAAALAHPCFIDSSGNLYVLRDDGATVLVAGPSTGTDVRFQGAGSGRQIAWVAAQERLFVRFNESAQCTQAALPRVRDAQGVPEYRRSALAVASPSNAYLVHNTEDALYCFAVAPDGIRLCAKVMGHKGFGAWMEGGNLYIFGMRTRIHHETKSTISTTLLGFWFKHGIGTLLQIDLSSGRVRIDSATDTKKALIAAWVADAGESDDRYVKPLLEAWLDSVKTNGGRVLIGAIADYRPPGGPDGLDVIIEEPSPLDFVGIALYRWREGKKVELLRLLHGFHYIGRIAGPEVELLYFVKPDDPCDEFKDCYFAMRVSPDMQSPLLPLAFDWAKGSLWTVQFDPSHVLRVGAIASVTTKLRDTALPYRRHLAMSENGFDWRFVHPLPDSRV